MDRNEMAELVVTCKTLALAKAKEAGRGKSHKNYKEEWIIRLAGLEGVRIMANDRDVRLRKLRGRIIIFAGGLPIGIEALKREKISGR